MNRQVIDLGHILRQFPDLDFGMDDFEHRLRTQKFVYILQTFGIYLGYDYSWYLRGPYCTSLATIGFALSKIYGDVPYDKGLVFVNPGIQERFEQFKEFIKGRENDNGFLEIAASLHMLKKTSGLDRGEIIKKVADKQGMLHRRAVRRHLGGDGAVGSHAVGRDGEVAQADRRPPSPAGVAPSSGRDTEQISIRDIRRKRPDMEQRPADVGLCHLLADAIESGDEIVLVGQNVFREEYKHPHIDEIIVPTAGLVEGMVWGR